MGCCASNEPRRPNRGGAKPLNRNGSTAASQHRIRRSVSYLQAGTISKNYYKCPNPWCLRTIDKALYRTHREACDMLRSYQCVKCGCAITRAEYAEHIKNCHPVQCPTCPEKVIKSLLPHCPNVMKQRAKVQRPTTDAEAAQAIQRFVRGMKVTKSWYAIIFRLIWFKIDRWDERGLFKSVHAPHIAPHNGDGLRVRDLYELDHGMPFSPSRAELPKDGIEVLPPTAKGSPGKKSPPRRGSSFDVPEFLECPGSPGSCGSLSEDDNSISGDITAVHHLNPRRRKSDGSLTGGIGNLSLNSVDVMHATTNGGMRDFLGFPETSSKSRSFRRASLLVRDGKGVQAAPEDILPYPDGGFASLTDQELEDHIASLRDVVSYQKLSRTYAVSLLTDGRAQLQQLPNIQQLDLSSGFCIVVGDTHGQLQDLSRILEDRGLPSRKMQYIFNGDFVDRGCNSCEVFFLILALFLAYPDYVVLNRGNHESLACTDHYGCHEEVLSKYSESVYELMLEVFDCIPLCTIINEQVLVVHGGIPRYEDVTLAEINLIDRYQEIPVQPESRAEQIFMDMMWSDPDPEPYESGTPAWEHNAVRDAGCKWRLPLTRNFVERNGLKMIIRSHHPPHAGYETLHNDLVSTVFSASNYTGIDSNHGAIAVVKLRPGTSQLTVMYDTWKVYDPLDKTVDHRADGGTLPVPSSPVSPVSVVDGSGYFTRTLAKWMHTAEDAVVEQIREKVFQNLHVLMAAFCEVDTTDRGSVWKSEWVDVMSSLISEDIPWYFVRRYVADVDPVTHRIQFSKFIRRHNLPVMQQMFTAWLPHTVKWLRVQCQKHQDHSVESIFDLADENHSGTLYYTEFFELVTNRLGTLLNKDLVLMLYNAFDPQCSGYCARSKWVALFQKFEKSGYILEVENWVGMWEADPRQFIMWDFWLLQRFKKYLRKLPPQTAYRLLDREHKGYINALDLAHTIDKMALGAEGHTDHQKKTGATAHFDFRKRVKYRVVEPQEDLAYVASLFGVSEKTVRDGLSKTRGMTVAVIQIWPLSMEQLESFLSRLDFDRDGKVTYTDFQRSFCVQDSILLLEEAESRKQFLSSSYK